MTPLLGIKVIEIAQNLAGPFCGEILGTFGADVIKVEKRSGDDCRFWGPPFPGGFATAFHNVNLNKRGITLDLENAADRDVLLELIGACDILIHNMRPGVMEAFGLGPEALRARFPRLIYGVISGFGAVGPLRQRPGYDAIVQAMVGLFHLNGAPDSPPSRMGPSVLDFGSGVWLALGLLAALRQRDQTGQGCLIDTSLYETALSFISAPIAASSASGQPPPRLRAGIGKVVPFEAFATTDGEVVVAGANDRLFAKFAKVVGHPEWATDERYRTNSDRYRHKDVLLTAIAATMRARSSAEWLADLEAAGIPCARINTLAEALEHPQTQAVDMLHTDAQSGVTLCRLPLRFDAERPPITRFAPALGEHNDEILGRFQNGEAAA